MTILHEEANRGRTLLEEFADHAAEAGFAVVLLTADDVERMKTQYRRSCLNYLVQDKMSSGRRLVCAVYETGVELPSDLHGLAYVEHDSAGLWKHAVAKEIHAAGIEVDFSKL